jgi:hypothetical protein
VVLLQNKWDNQDNKIALKTPFCHPERHYEGSNVVVKVFLSF